MATAVTPIAVMTDCTFSKHRSPTPRNPKGHSRHPYPSSASCLPHPRGLLFIISMLLSGSRRHISEPGELIKPDGHSSQMFEFLLF